MNHICRTLGYSEVIIKQLAKLTSEGRAGMMGEIVGVANFPLLGRPLRPKVKSFEISKGAKLVKEVDICGR